MIRTVRQPKRIRCLQVSHNRRYKCTIYLMKETSVPSEKFPEVGRVLQCLTESLSSLTPELQKTAAYVLENPNEIGVSSIREIAAKARVKPNSLVRMARRIGFEGYENFRSRFVSRFVTVIMSIVNRRNGCSPLVPEVCPITFMQRVLRRLSPTWKNCTP